MSCSPFDLNDYFLKELPDSGRRQVEQHLGECGRCREELERLRLTEASLFALREEEIPQRIAFVSDKVFEPSWWRRGLAAFWGSAARLGFASAAMLSVAIVIYGLAVTSRTPAVYRTTHEVTAADIQARIDTAVQKAVAESEARQAERTEKLVAEFMNREKEEDKQLASAASYIQYQDRQLGAVDAAVYRHAGGGAQ